MVVALKCEFVFAFFLVYIEILIVVKVFVFGQGAWCIFTTWEIKVDVECEGLLVRFTNYVQI